MKNGTQAHTGGSGACTQTEPSMDCGPPTPRGEAGGSLGHQRVARGGSLTERMLTLPEGGARDIFGPPVLLPALRS